MMKVKILGTRGSFVSVEEDKKGYGRNSSCYYVDAGMHLFLDAGTGILNSEKLVADEKPVHILLSHLHIDHVLGLFECPFLYEAGRQVHIYGETRKGKDLLELLDALIGPPYWPIKLSGFPCDLHFHEIREREGFVIEDLKVSTLRSCHPDGCLSFVLENGGKKLGYALDHEAALDKEKKAERFFENCDLLIFDGNDLPGQNKAGYGHSDYTQGITLAEKAGIKKLLIGHYGYAADDAVLKREEDKAADSCIFAKEGMEIIV
ncbi:MAG: MBL fold metallo-hydrolase [Erysipelotrichaceae bacterium]|nr:MBL fold metallo-hydrolase [Erysipelotrichaceae bacterium]